MFRIEGLMICLVKRIMLNKRIIRMIFIQSKKGIEGKRRKMKGKELDREKENMKERENE